MIVTAGAIDCHVHFICPQLAYEAISSGEDLNSPYSYSFYVICLPFLAQWLASKYAKRITDTI